MHAVFRRAAESEDGKLGLTSAAPPTTPIVGTLLDDMVLPTGSDLSLATMVAPMVEAEFVVHIGETVDRALNIADLERGPPGGP